MGQRHQFFAIARINNRYRTLAVIHNQWLYGHSAVRQCLITMRVLSATGNMQRISRDLKLAESKPESFWEAKPKDQGERGVDFPFIMVCLSLGCGTNPDGPGAGMIHELSIDAKFDTVHNDDGISVFDVTEPGNPKYAMMRLTGHDGIEMGADGEYVEIDTEPHAFKPFTILNASEYLLRYGQSTSVSSPQALDSLPQLDVAALTSVWPHGSFRGRKNGNVSNSAEEAQSSTNSVKSLTAASMRAVIERTVHGDPSDIEVLAEAEQVPAFTESLRAHLHSNPKIVQGRRFSTLLGHIYRNSAVVDLSPFWLLTFDDVLAITETVAGAGHGFCLLLPNLEDLTASNFCKLLSSGFIRELDVGKHQVGDLGQFLHAIDGTSVTSFNVPELYSRSFARVNTRFASALEEAIEFRYGCGPWISPVPPLPRPKQFPVTQLAFVQCSTARFKPASERQDQIAPWSEILTIENLEEGRRGAPMLLSLPMSDYFLSVAQVIKRLPKFLSHLVRPVPHESSHTLGCVLMGLLYSLALKDDLTVEPLPGELTAFASRHAARTPSPFVPTLPLEQGRYTIVIFYEHIFKEDKEYPLRLRHGFATLDSEGKTKVISASDLAHALEPGTRATELAREWEEEATRVCGALENKQRRMVRRLVRREGMPGWSARTEKEIDRMGVDDVPSLTLEVSSPAEVDELFKALGESGRLATDS